MIALIDGDSLIYYEAFKKDSEGNPQSLEDAQLGINKRLSYLLEKVGTDRYVGWLTGSKNFRYKVAKSKGYKSSRPVEKPELLTQLKQYMQEVLHFVIQDGLEADDMVVYWHKQMEEETTICSPDKDVFKQTRGVHYNYRWSKTEMGKFVTTSSEDAELFLWQQVLMGDSTDDIPGLPKVGEKTAQKMLSENSSLEKHYSTVALEAYIAKFGIAEGVSRFAETFKLVYMLQTPEDVMREIGVELEMPNIIKVKL
jgi:DNA polymerase-1